MTLHPIPSEFPYLLEKFSFILSVHDILRTLIKRKFFPIYKEIQRDHPGAKSYMSMINGLLIYGEICAHFLIYQETLPHI